MTFKQKFKILGLIIAIIGTIFMFFPNMYFKYMDKKYTLFDLVDYNGFNAGVLFVIIFMVVVIASILVSISYDKNKYIPIVTLVAALAGGILVLFIRQFASPSGSISAKEDWMDHTKLLFGSITTSICFFLIFITSLIITIRSFILNKNDDEYLEYVEENDEQDDETDGGNEEENEETNDDDKVDLGDDLPDYEKEILEEFKK